MPTRLILMLMAMLLAGASIACSARSSPRRTPTLEPTPVPPTAVPTSKIPDNPLSATGDAIAGSPILRASGWLIYSRGSDLYAGDLATGNEMPLTRGSLSAGYAGRAEIEGKIWIYYTSIVDETHDPRAKAGRFAMYRRVLGSANADGEKMFEFSASDRYVVDAPNASVSSDGQHMAYTDDAGLHLYSPESNDDQVVLSNQPATSRFETGGGVRGLRYSSPIWAPAGDWLYVRVGDNRWPYNGHDETMRPLESTAEYRLARHADEWSPDGEHLCGDTSQTAAGGIGILTPGSTETIDYTPNLFDNAILRPALGSCTWAEDGRLAVGYDVDNLRHFTIAILDAFGMPIARVDAGAVYPELHHWLPDLSGFVVETLADDFVPKSAAVLLGGTYRRLPFAVERVLGMIPAP